MDSFYDDLKFFNGKVFSDNYKLGKCKHNNKRTYSPMFYFGDGVRRRITAKKHIEIDFTLYDKFVKRESLNSIMQY
jgi:hypothetical protein